MPKPLSRRDLLTTLRTFGWTGPFSGKRHQYLVKDGKRLIVPNPHHGDIDWSLTKRIIAHAAITREEWDIATGQTPRVQGKQSK